MLNREHLLNVIIDGDISSLNNELENALIGNQSVNLSDYFSKYKKKTCNTTFTMGNTDYNNGVSDYGCLGFMSSKYGKKSGSLICLDCFINGNYSDNDFHIICARDIGVCDCGNPFQWDEKGNCNNHQCFSDTESEKIDDNVVVFIECLVNGFSYFIKNYDVDEEDINERVTIVVEHLITLASYGECIKLLIIQKYKDNDILKTCFFNLHFACSEAYCIFVTSFSSSFDFVVYFLDTLFKNFDELVLFLTHKVDDVDDEDNFSYISQFLSTWFVSVDSLAILRMFDFDEEIMPFVHKLLKLFFGSIKSQKEETTKLYINIIKQLVINNGLANEIVKKQPRNCEDLAKFFYESVYLYCSSWIDITVFEESQEEKVNYLVEIYKLVIECHHFIFELQFDKSIILENFCKKLNEKADNEIIFEDVSSEGKEVYCFLPFHVFFAHMMYEAEKSKKKELFITISKMIDTDFDETIKIIVYFPLQLITRMFFLFSSLGRYFEHSKYIIQLFSPRLGSKNTFLLYYLVRRAFECTNEIDSFLFGMASCFGINHTSENSKKEYERKMLFFLYVSYIIFDSTDINRKGNILEQTLKSIIYTENKTYHDIYQNFFKNFTSNALSIQEFEQCLNRSFQIENNDNKCYYKLKSEEDFSILCHSFSSKRFLELAHRSMKNNDGLIRFPNSDENTLHNVLNSKYLLSVAQSFIPSQTNIGDLLAINILEKSNNYSKFDKKMIEKISKLGEHGIKYLIKNKYITEINNKIEAEKDNIKMIKEKYFSCLSSYISSEEDTSEYAEILECPICKGTDNKPFGFPALIFESYAPYLTYETMSGNENPCDPKPMYNMVCCKHIYHSECFGNSTECKLDNLPRNVILPAVYETDLDMTQLVDSFLENVMKILDIKSPCQAILHLLSTSLISYDSKLRFNIEHNHQYSIYLIRNLYGVLMKQKLTKSSEILFPITNFIFTYCTEGEESAFNLKPSLNNFELITYIRQITLFISSISDKKYDCSNIDTLKELFGDYAQHISAEHVKIYHFPPLKPKLTDYFICAKKKRGYSFNEVYYSVLEQKYLTEEPHKIGVYLHLSNKLDIIYNTQGKNYSIFDLYVDEDGYPSFYFQSGRFLYLNKKKLLDTEFVFSTSSRL